MNNWLHFIGRQYYTESQFLEESSSIGCSRRVALNVLKIMNFGDRVYCAMIRNNEKSPVVLGCFTIEQLGGLSPESTIPIHEVYPSQMVDLGGKTVLRRCGIYTTGPSYIVTNGTLEGIANLLSHEDNPGTLLIQGTWTPLENPIRLTKVKFRQGYRRFNVEKAVADALENRYHRAAGQYYVVRNIDVEPWPYASVQVVTSYRKFDKGEW